MQEFKLPDVYMCLPSTVVAKFTLKDKKHDKEWNGCQSRKVVCGNGWEDLEASTDPPPPDNYITGDLSGCPALIEMFGCEHPDYTEWAQANCQTTCSQKTNCKVVAEAQPIAGKDCQFRMLDESMVRGRCDIQGSNSGDGNNPLGGASLQIRSGFGETSESRAEVPLYAMESFDLLKYAGTDDPPVANMTMGGAGYQCTEEQSNTDAGCPEYALDASNTPLPYCSYTCHSRVTLSLSLFRTCLLLHRFGDENYVNINAWLKDDDDFDKFSAGRPLGGQLGSHDPVMGDVATTLALLHPNYTAADQSGNQRNVTAICFLNKMKPTAKSHYENNTDVWLSFASRVAPGDISAFTSTAGMFWQIYTAEQGVLPYVEIKGRKVINASYFTVPFVNTFTKVDLTPAFFKDETLGTSHMFETKTMDYFAEEFEQTGYFSHPHNVDAPKEWAENYVAIAFRHFTRRVHVRYKTLSEIWAEIGALWAGAMIIMSLFFTPSGTTDVKTKKPMMVFSPPILAPVPVLGGMISKARKKYVGKNEDELKAAQEKEAALEGVELRTSNGSV